MNFLCPAEKGGGVAKGDGYPDEKQREACSGSDLPGRLGFGLKEF